MCVHPEAAHTTKQIMKWQRIMIAVALQQLSGRSGKYGLGKRVGKIVP
jgi:hypothetical protein